MNDEFLTQLYEAPRAEFAEALYQRISRQSQSPFAGPMLQRLTFRNAAMVFALLFFVAACVYAVTDRGWRKVGGIWVNVERTYKLDFGPPPEISEGQNIQPVVPECLPVEEAKKVLRFEIRVPAWAPEGYTFMNEICGIDEFSDFAGLSWKGPEKNSWIQIMAGNLRWFNMATQKYEVGPPTVWIPVGPGSYKEVQIHGQPAVLVRGDWDIPRMQAVEPPESQSNQQVDVKWNKKQALQLHWVDGETIYSLYSGTDVSVEDLIKMAESAQ